MNHGHKKQEITCKPHSWGHGGWDGLWSQILVASGRNVLFKPGALQMVGRMLTEFEVNCWIDICAEFVKLEDGQVLRGNYRF